MSKIGFIGLGRMGRPMTTHLVKKGFDLIVLDINRALDFSGMADVLCGLANIEKPRLPKRWQPG